ncbi:MAG: 16S rRNA (uracil(1498)-N(3))-methyltransferase [Elusimicrobia bacterium]|nr:16S rRNA (uracil(1498)-N(3))-methyltransferase [Elusimicrobiota bacterium]
MQFLVSTLRPKSGVFEIVGGEARHIVTVLRKKSGDILRLFDGKGSVYWGRIGEMSPERVSGVILGEPPQHEARGLTRAIEITLYQALPKGPKWGWVLEKGCELGILRFVPVMSSRVIGRPTASGVPVKMERWRRVVRAACKQSGLALLPEIARPMNFKEALADSFQKNEVVLMAWESEKAAPLWEIIGALGRRVKSLAVLIGPEGGWSLDEVDLARAHGCHLVSLGPHVLRAETAPIVAVSMIYALVESKNNF